MPWKSNERERIKNHDERRYRRKAMEHRRYVVVRPFHKVHVLSIPTRRVFWAERGNVDHSFAGIWKYVDVKIASMAALPGA